MIEKLRAAVTTTSPRGMPVLSTLQVPALIGGGRGSGTQQTVHETRVTRNSQPANRPRVNRQTSTQNVIVTPSPPKPLLLEGDEFCISEDGISRTYYELKSWAEDDASAAMPVSLEEKYDLNSALKTFVVRRGHSSNRFNTRTQNVAMLGSPLSVFELQEIDQGVLRSAGTGATTWESSIAMSLFFSSNPNMLRGDIIELGSGVGLAGLLGQIMTPTASLPAINSLTLTDVNAQVLEQCQRNLDQVSLTGLPTQVEKLDWYDVVNKKESDSVKKYDTVLASDCCYRYSDVAALTSTMTSLCRKDEHSRIHVFGPYNRAALHELVNQLRNDCGMNVEMNWIEMSRYRLLPQESKQHTATGSRFLDVDHDECPFASRNIAKFLHITAWHRTSMETNGCKVQSGVNERSLSDID